MSCPLTPQALERAAEALATACNGGDWTRDYTAAQRKLWRSRVTTGLAVHPDPFRFTKEPSA
jgi:hypothetical protein